MKGLLLKELLLARKSWKVLLIILLFYGVWGVMDSSMLPMLSSMSVLMAMMMAVSSFSYDDLARWPRYQDTLPVSRTQVVLCKYLAALLLVLAGAGIALLAQGLLLLVQGPNDWIPLAFLAGSLLAGILLISLTFPLFYRFGVEKGRLFLMAALLLPTMLIVLLSKSGLPAPDEQTILRCLLVSPLLVAGALVLSVFISCRIYQNREL